MTYNLYFPDIEDVVVIGDVNIEVTVADLQRAGGDTSVYDALMNVLNNGIANNNGKYFGSDCQFTLTKIERKFHK